MALPAQAGDELRPFDFASLSRFLPSHQIEELRRNSGSHGQSRSFGISDRGFFPNLIPPQKEEERCITKYP
jgi:hypothetical protein